MDAYSSLLNLNFMASLRTGNLIVDMLIAVLIPLVSGAVAYFFDRMWPNALETFLGWLSPTRTETEISAKMRDVHRALDLDENDVLQEALMQFVGKTVRPLFPMGDYKFKRLPARENCSPSSLAELLKQSYSIHTVPIHDAAIEVSDEVKMRICLEEEEKDDEHNRNNNNGGLGGGGGANKPKLERVKQEKMIFETNVAPLFGSTADPMLEWCRTAFTWYKKEISSVVDSQRYLYQPVSQRDGADTSKGPRKYQRYPLSTDKTFNTLFFPQKPQLMHLISQFESKSGKFAVPGFPQRLLLLLHGPPGTGKTSLVKAIAAHTNRHIVSIPLSRVRTNHELLCFMFDTTCEVVNEKKVDAYFPSEIKEKLKSEKVVYMLEDVDAASEVARGGQTTSEAAASANNTPPPAAAASSSSGKEEGEAEPVVEKVVLQSKDELDQLSISGLLNALGGILDAPRRIVVMTTNHLDHLHPSLVRPGVVTMKLHMGTFSPECAVEMVRHYFGGSSTPVREDTLKKIFDIVAVARTGETGESAGGGFSPAEVEQLCAESDSAEELLHALARGPRRNVF